jgi:flagellar basal-body rod modification protein FlgD
VTIPVNPTLGTTTAQALGAIPGATPSTQNPALLGKDDFLKLLIAQLRNQNPLNPLSNDQFITQSAQFSTVESLQNIQKSLNTMSANSGSSAVAAGTALLGRSVAATAGTFTYAGATVSLPFTLGGSLEGGLLEISDANGAILSRVPLGLRDAGSQSFDLHPGQTGPSLRSGTYRYRILAPDAQGRVTALPAVTGVVTGVSLDNGTPVLSLGSRTVDLADVTAVGATTN